MKPPISETTTSQEAQHSKTGTQVGAHGSATRSSLVMQDGEADHAKVDEGLALLTRLRRSLSTDTETKARNAVAMLSQQADGKWMMAQVIALLLPYYEKDTAQSVRAIEAKKWAKELEGHPQWALERAFHWWGSKHNPKRMSRPVHGAISAQCEVEMAEVNLMKTAILRLPKAPPPPEKPKGPPSDAEKARIAQELARNGYKRPKPMQSEQQTQDNINAAKDMSDG